MHTVNRIARALLVLMLGAITSACTPAGGEAYVGTWQSTKNPKEILVISRVEGEQFRIDATKPNPADGPRTPIQVTAALRDGALIPVGWSAAVVVIHLPETDTLSAQRPLGGTIPFNRIR